MRVLLAAGGTAGHIEPALATADALRERAGELGGDVEPVILGTESGLESALVPPRGYRLRTIPRVPLPRSASREVLTLPGRVTDAVRSTLTVIDEEGVGVVVGFGGYVSAPAYLAAKRRSIPIVVHEANVRPGVANRLGARLTPFVATGLPGCDLPRARYVGMPLRPAIADLDRAAVRDQARSAFGLDDRPTVLVFGGSQGARRITDAVIAAQEALAEAGLQVLLAPGRANADAAREALDPSTVVVVPYIDRMDLAYAAADAVVARAGAMTCAELAAVGLPSILVPLPIGNGEQRLNARPLVDAGAAVLIDDDAFGASALTRLVVPLLADPARLSAMGAAAKALGRTDGADALADLVVEAWRGRAAS